MVGEYCVGKTDALTPDIRDPKSHSLYDSTVGLLSGDTMANPSIYVTYHDAQVSVFIWMGPFLNVSKDLSLSLLLARCC